MKLGLFMISAAALGAEPLGELRRGQAPRGIDRRSRGLAHRAHPPRVNAAIADSAGTPAWLRAKSG